MPKGGLGGIWMQFLKTLFWVVAAAVGAVLAYANWHDVEFLLWGEIIVDIKLPVLLLLVFLLGFAPPFLIYRTRLWRLRRRLASLERQSAPGAAAPPSPVAEAEAPVS